MVTFRNFIVIGIAAPVILTASQNPKLIDLGTLKNDNSGKSYGYAISADGNVIVGTFEDLAGALAFKYSNGLMQSLGTLPGGLESFAYAVSADGSVIVGYSTINGMGHMHAFKYSNGQMQDLGTFVGGTNSWAQDISADGSVIVGSSQNSDNHYHAFKYSNGLMLDLGTLGGDRSDALAVSADGSVIVGSSTISGQEPMHAFKYSNGSMEDLGTFGGDNSWASDVSSDGSVIVGTSQDSDNHYHAFKYSNGQMEILGNNLGGTSSEALGVSADGSTIVGSATINGMGHRHAFKYSNGQMQDLGTLGGNSSWADDISADGSVIVGYSLLPDNSTYHAFLYYTSMVDLDNTISSSLQSGQQLNGLLNLKNLLLANQLNRDCTHFGENGFGLSISAGYPHTNRPSTHQVNTALTAGYRVDRRLRLGATVDFGFANTTLANIHAPQGEPLVGVFAVLNANDNHQGAQLKIAAATSSSKVQITRSTLPNTEAGQGWSHLTSHAALAEIAYNLPSFKSVSLQPYLGMRLVKTTRDSYQETSGATFPISYGRVKQEATTILLGAKAHTFLNKIALSATVGLERDIRQHCDYYTGTVISPIGAPVSALSLQASQVRKTRLSASAGACYDIAKAQQIAVSAQFSQLPNNRSKGLMGCVSYNIGF